MKDLLQKYMTIINFITHCEREIVCVCVCVGGCLEKEFVYQ